MEKSASAAERGRVSAQDYANGARGGGGISGSGNAAITPSIRPRELAYTPPEEGANLPPV